LTGVLQQSSDEHVAVKLLALSAALLPGEADVLQCLSSLRVSPVSLAGDPEPEVSSKQHVLS
jgi:hypothetical protein